MVINYDTSIVIILIRLAYLQDLIIPFYLNYSNRQSLNLKNNFLNLISL